jgi:DNA modification methylase
LNSLVSTAQRCIENAFVSPHLEIIRKRLSELKDNPRNARTHTKKQIRQIVESMRRFGFVVPILINADGTIIAGHGRWEAAKILGLKEVPTICLSHLNEAEIIALMILDNRLTENSTWDERLLGEQFKELAALNLDFDLEITGFETPQIDLMIQGLTPESEGPDPADQIPNVEQCIQVAQPGDLWELDNHRVLCGDARESLTFDQLMREKCAAMVFTDPPYNLRIDGVVSGKGIVKHPDFVMGSGELTEAQFIEFLIRALTLLARHSIDGALVFISIDWRHLGELIAAGKTTFSELKNVCVWIKDRAGMGSLYRSAHEFVFVFKSGTSPHINNIELGRFGRYRTNVWQYPSAVSFGHAHEEGNLLALHPTVKPVAMVADAILDCSKRNDIVLDSFLGSGTTVVAAEKTGRICHGMEIDPKYVDVIVRRWQAFTGQTAVHAQSGRTFTQIEEEVKNVGL